MAGRARVRIPALLLGGLVAGAIVLGSWWALGSPSDPIDQNPVQALAFVASSPSCVDSGDRAAGRRLTVVDVVGGASPVRPVRTTVDACGYRDGQQVAVQYLAGDISRARLSGTSTAGDTGSAGRLLPIGLLVAGLLAAAATIALVADGRRSRRRCGADEWATARHARISGAEFLLFARSEPAASSRPVRRPADPASVAATPSTPGLPRPARARRDRCATRGPRAGIRAGRRRSGLLVRRSLGEPARRAVHPPRRSGLEQLVSRPARRWLTGPAPGAVTVMP